MNKRIIPVILSLLICMTIIPLNGCKQEEPPKYHRTTAATTEAVSTTSKMVVLTQIDTESRNLKFQGVKEQEISILPYTATTWFYSRFGEAIAPAQLEPGDVVTITYDTHSNLISEVRRSSDKELMENTKVTNFSIDEVAHTMRIGSTLFYYDESSLVFSDGKQIQFQELNSTMDQLHVWAYGTKITSVIVDKGHGYLALSGESLFLDGLISVGNILVRDIEDDMLLTVAEGSYTVRVEHKQYTATKEVTIHRGEKTVVDFSDISASLQETGNVRFQITTSTAKLFIDGREYDYSTIVTIAAGKHKIVVSAEGLENSFNETVTIDPDFQILKINLEGEDPTETETDADAPTQTETDAPTQTETTKPEETTEVVSKTNKVTVSGPVGASVYFDNEYMGVAPVTFALVTGSHYITVLEGTRIRSYSVNLAEGGDDVVYDFSE